MIGICFSCRLGAVGGRITSYSYTNTPFPLWAPRLILLEALSSPGGGRKSNQRRLTGEIALRTLGGTRRVDVCVAAPAGARDFDLFVGIHAFIIHSCNSRSHNCKYYFIIL